MILMRHSLGVFNVKLVTESVLFNLKELMQLCQVWAEWLVAGVWRSPVATCRVGKPLYCRHRA